MTMRGRLFASLSILAIALMTTLFFKSGETKENVDVSELDVVQDKNIRSARSEDTSAEIESHKSAHHHAAGMACKSCDSVAKKENGKQVVETLPLDKEVQEKIFEAKNVRHS